MNVQTFWCEPTGTCRVQLEIYGRGDEQPCVARGGSWGCRAEVVIADDVPEEEGAAISKAIGLSGDDPRWPTHCDHCGVEFDAKPKRTISRAPYMTGAPDGEVYPIRDLPPGAMYDADFHGREAGSDAIDLVVKLPNHTLWYVDHRTADHTAPWTRTGDPRKANVTARPSVRSGEPGTPGHYHGFLTNGVLEPCGDSQT